jgi:hypothetical protein
VTNTVAFLRTAALWLIALAVQSAVAVFASFVAGYFPEALAAKLFHDTALEPYAPVVAIVALVLGTVASARIFGGKAALATWVVGLLWLCVGVRDLTAGWRPGWLLQASAWRYITANLFGRSDACGITECLEEFAFTMPATLLVMYSLGAALRRMRMRSLRHSDG